MTRVNRSRLIAADPQDVWDVVGDPYHLPRWWPGVERVEDVTEEHWTHVLRTRKGKPVRADFRLVSSDPPRERTWEQEVAGTPFERFLAQSVTTMRLDADGSGTRVTIEQEVRLRGYSRTGGWQLRRATRRILNGVLDGLQQIWS